MKFLKIGLLALVMLCWDAQAFADKVVGYKKIDERMVTCYVDSNGVFYLIPRDFKTVKMEDGKCPGLYEKVAIDKCPLCYEKSTLGQTLEVNTASKDRQYNIEQERETQRQIEAAKVAVIVNDNANAADIHDHIVHSDKLSMMRDQQTQGYIVHSNALSKSRDQKTQTMVNNVDKKVSNLQDSLNEVNCAIEQIAGYIDNELEGLNDATKKLQEEFVDLKQAVECTKEDIVNTILMLVESNCNSTPIEKADQCIWYKGQTVMYKKEGECIVGDSPSKCNRLFVNIALKDSLDALDLVKKYGETKYEDFVCNLDRYGDQLGILNLKSKEKIYVGCIANYNYLEFEFPKTKKEKESKENTNLAYCEIIYGQKFDKGSNSCVVKIEDVCAELQSVSRYTGLCSIGG
jgi:hypothetical protein